jgi:hypothetical protein
MSAPKRPLDDYSALELCAVGLFFIAGAILALAFGVVYVGVNLINMMGATWRFIWQ